MTEPRPGGGRLRRRAAFPLDVLRARRHRPMLPRMLTYIVTFGCNARCSMCDSWQKPTEGDLALEEIERIFDGLPVMDAVRLSGGEPFVRRDLPQIAEAVRTRLEPLVLHVTSNGFLTKRIVEFCETRERSLPLRLLISIDGVGAIHDEIRGRRGAYRDALRTVEELAPRQKELNLRLGVNQTILDRDGIEQYRALRQRLEPLGVVHNAVLAYAGSATYSLEEEGAVVDDQIGTFRPFGAFATEDLRELMEEIGRDSERLSPMERRAKRFYLAAMERTLGGAGEPPPPCAALGAHLRLLPDGSVPVCQFNGTVLGNLREQPFGAVWRAPATENARDWVHACPGCLAECELVPSAIYTGSLLVGSPSGGDGR